MAAAAGHDSGHASGVGDQRDHGPDESDDDEPGGDGAD